MIERNLDGSQVKIFCDRCSKELINTNVVKISAGDVLCTDCFAHEYNIISTEDIIREESEQSYNQ